MNQLSHPEPRPRRSALYLPASNPRAIAKARTLACDVVILDLEDAVAPEMKALARDQAAAALREGGFGARELVVRINGLDTEWGADDLAALREATTILVPKVSTAADVAAVAAALAPDTAPDTASVTAPVTSLWVMIETALSIFRLEEIAAAARTAPLAALVMGTNDLAKEMGAEPGIDRAPLVGMLGMAVAAARAHGLVVLDGVYNDLSDEAGFMAQARQARRFGFDGKTLIHPDQVAWANAAFTPSAAEIVQAEGIVAAFDRADNVGKGAIRLDGRMVERLHLVQARRTLAMRD